jgi:acyl-CoA reductase-like NAD-dependent aldehyde dehydrogenase
VGDPLVDHDDVALITFTGSPEVGWAIRGRTAREDVGLKLQNAPVILEPDADITTAGRRSRSRLQPRDSRASPPSVYVHESRLRSSTNHRS